MADVQKDDPNRFAQFTPAPAGPSVTAGKPIHVGMREDRVGNRMVSVQNLTEIRVGEAQDENRKDLVDIIRALGGSAGGGESLLQLRREALELATKRQDDLKAAEALLAEK